MNVLPLAPTGRPLSVLCIGAHSDDIELGVGGTIRELIGAGIEIDATWCVLSAIGPRREEAAAGAQAMLDGARHERIELANFRDGYFPQQGTEIKDWFEDLKASITPDIVFTHRGDDAHQDHREVSRLTWNTFRDHVILEYEIPKWDGDLARPNAYVAVSTAAMTQKMDILQSCFGTQRGKDWFDSETFRGLARIRGMECRAPERYAEAFIARKLRLF